MHTLRLIKTKHGWREKKKTQIRINQAIRRHIKIRMHRKREREREMFKSVTHGLIPYLTGTLYTWKTKKQQYKKAKTIIVCDGFFAFQHFISGHSENNRMISYKYIAFLSLRLFQFCLSTQMLFSS